MKERYDSFDKLKENVSETYSNMAMLLEKFGWGFFSDDGADRIETYEILDEGFQFSADHNDLVKYVANEIAKLNSDGKTEIVAYLIKYVRHNFDREFWKDYPEFTWKHEYERFKYMRVC